ncbi:spore coat protein YsxE [Bacillus sp. FSL R5-0820]|uniref:spore coat protein YsxE n=1 Tax=Bacillus TaxID=1386 RepID=UPI002105D92C|nr:MULTISPECIES: spore coat protein YsxE [Bacillus]MCA0925333.1 spore coat protein YsxE [Bacillus stratosphericus]UJM26548.1 spore coat protein YsxE [Bacillus aerophilus]WOI40095.1 spore coat protein YsxE [Bacillus altitudinis]
MDEIQSVLYEYGLEAEYIEPVSPAVVRVYTKQGVFALKRVKPHRQMQFTEQMLELESKGYRSFVPIYRTKSGSFFSNQRESQYTYYLMPWLTNEKREEQDDKHEYLFQEIARLHKRTEVMMDITEQEIEAHYTQMKSKWETEKDMYERFIERAEQTWYMSPFELAAAMYFSEAMSASEFALERLEDWHEEMKDQETTRIVLNHGQLSIHHFLYNDVGTGHFTNFERSKKAAPIYDLLTFYYRTFKTYPTPCPECTSLFYTYQKGNKLREEEIHLFLSYLAYPQGLFDTVKAYEAGGQDEMESCQELLRAYWQMKNSEPIVMKIHEIEQARRLEEEQNASSSEE